MGSRFGLMKKTTATPTTVFASDHGMDMDMAVTIVSTATYGGVKTLKKGMILGKITSGGKYSQYDNANVDGTEVAAGVLTDECDMTFGSSDGVTAVDQLAVIRVHGAVDESQCSYHIGGGLVTGSVEAAAKTDLPMISWR